MSKNPGATTSPLASRTGISATLTSPMARILPSRISRLPTVSKFRSGSTSRPSLISRSMSPHQQVEDCHPDGNARRHLVENYGKRAVSDVGRNLDAAIDRPGMHDDDVRLSALRALMAQPV